MYRFVVPAMMLTACKGGKEDVPLGSSDVRIDQAGDADTYDSSGTRMCADGAGSVYVVWDDDRGGKSGVWFNGSKDAGKTWFGGAVGLDGGKSHATNPDIACNADGGVFVVWEDDRDGELAYTNIYFAWSKDYGVTWNEAKSLDDDVEGDAISLKPRIVASGDDVDVVWYDARDGAYDIYEAASTTAGATFTLPVRVDSDEAGAAYSANPRVATDGGGHVYVAWEDSRSGASDVYFAVWKDHGATFPTDQRVDGGDDPGSADSFEPELATDGSGTIYVVWHDLRDGEARSVYANWSDDDGAKFAADAVRVDSDTPGLSDSIYPRVAVADGVAHVVWQDNRSTGYDIYYRRASGGDFGAEEVRVDTDGAGFANSVFPEVAVSGSNVVVAWEDARADDENLGYDDLYYNFSQDGGKTWTDDDLRIDSIEEGTKYAHDVNVSLQDRELLVAWTDGRNGSGDVYFHSLAMGDEAEYVPADTGKP